MRSFLDDLRVGVRTLLKSPGFTGVAVVVLAVGIGANCAIFSFLDALLLRPFPFHDLHELVTVWETHPQAGALPDAGHASVGRRYPAPPADFLDWSASEAFESVAAYRHRELNLSELEEPERLRGVQVTGGFFAMLGARPALGRTFLPEEETPGRDTAAVLTHVFWRDRFGSDPAVLGRTCTLNGRRYTVVGVMPKGFDFPLGGVRVFLPLALSAEERTDRTKLALQVLGRLKPDVPLARAQADLARIAARLEREHPRTNAGRQVALVPLAAQQVGFTARFALLFQAAAAVVLLVTCANVAGLLLARAWGRQREVAVRAALGAGRGRIVRTLLAESLALSLMGGALALPVAFGAVAFIRNSLPADIAQWVGGWSAIHVDARALAFTLAVACLTSVAVGLAPARMASRWELTDVLKDGGRASAARGHARLRQALVVAEITLALVLLGGAGLMVRGFVGMTSTYRGFEPEGVLTLRITLPGDTHVGPRAAAFYGSLLQRLEALPGVQSAAVASQVVGDLGPTPGGPFEVEGHGALSPTDLPAADVQTISGGYFRTLGVPLRAGRELRDGDGVAPAPPVAIVSDGVARRFWPSEDPVGRRLRLGPANAPGPWLQVVGVAADVRQYWYDDPRPTIYVPHAQAPRTQMCVLVRTTGDPYALVPQVRAQVQALERDQPVFEVMTLADVVRQGVAIVRMAATLMVALGVVALLLSALGVYGIVAQQVGQRTHEIGIRLAVGARPAQILGLVVGQAVRLASVGLLLGLPLTWGLSLVMRDALFGVAGPDPRELAVLTLVLVGAAAAASYLPARRAAGLDPAAVLRAD